MDLAYSSTTAKFARNEGFHIESIHFKADLLVLKHQAILRIPEGESAKLPSRGQVAVHGMINGHELRTVLEPDGYSGHWIRVDAGLVQEMGVNEGDSATVNLEVVKEWPEPDVPDDLARAMSAAPQKVKDKWNNITPMARWEWVRWVSETGNMDTRAARIETTISKLNGKHRRPCCFNLTACTDPELSRSGKLMAPPQSK